MMKRSLALLLAVMMTVSFLTVLSSSAEEVDGESVAIEPVGASELPAESGEPIETEGIIALETGFLKVRYDIEEGTAKIIGAEDLPENVVIPDTADGYPVVAIEDYALMGQDLVKSVTVPASVETIGMMAMGYSADSQKLDGFTVKSTEISTAADYADENGFAFIDVNADKYPHITSFENTEKGVKIKWDAFSRADSYSVYYQNAGGGWTRLASQTEREYVDTSVKGGETRVYTVRALKGDAFVSDFSRRGWSTTFISAPDVTLNNAENGVMIKWTPCAGAERYRIYYYGKNGWTRMVETAESSFLDTDVRSGNTYTYTVRCITADSKDFTSDYKAGKKILYVAAPRITSIENTVNGAKIKWDAVKGADVYRVYYKSDNGWTRLAAKTQTEYVDTSAKSGESRIYTVRCLNSKEEFVSDFVGSGWSNTFIASPAVTLSNAQDGVMIKWTASAGAEKYRVYYYGSKGWTRMADTTETEFLDTDVRSGTNYTYTVRCISSDGKSFMSDYNTGKKILYVAAPRFTSIENSDNGVLLKWDAVKGADFYRIYYKNASGGWTRLASKYLTEYVDTSVKNNETRIYTVRCLNEKEDFVSDFVHDGWSNTFHAPPAITSVSSVQDGNLVEWESGKGVAAYRLYRKIVGGSWSRLFDSTEETSYTDTTVEKGKIYAYTLRYMDADGNLISSYLDDVKYYKDGKAVNGVQQSDGVSYYFDKGYLHSGLTRINGKLYHYGNNGKLSKDTIVKVGSEYYYVDKDGICCESEEIRLAAAFMMEKCKGSTLKDKMKYGFQYLADNFPYQRYYDPPKKASDMPNLASSCFKNRNGNCYRYAAAFCCLARMAGYRARVAVGNTGGLPHGWTEVYVDGRWLVCDVDANIPQYHKADFAAYMMRNHFWPLSKSFSAELTIENGKAVWK